MAYNRVRRIYSKVFKGNSNSLNCLFSKTGGTLYNFGWGCAAGTLKHLPYTRPC